MEMLPMAHRARDVRMIRDDVRCGFLNSSDDVRIADCPS
ncbi:MAG: hypothetical protein RLZZ78_439, partial [Armatimonadota bacterium]